MTWVRSIGTYLPPWEKAGRRAKGTDEDALTMAVAAGRAADPDATARRVVMVSRNFPLLEGGNGAVLLAGLSLDADCPVSEVLGGAPAVLDQILMAPPGTLVIAADDTDTATGAAAMLAGETGVGAELTETGRQTRSLPLIARRDDGSRHVYIDPRLQRQIGVRSTLARLRPSDASPVAAVAGISAAQLDGSFEASAAIEDTTVSTSAVIRLIADAVGEGISGLVLAVEQASVSTALLTSGETRPRVVRDEAPASEQPKTRIDQGEGIPISLAAYARAFEPKLRWEAAVFEELPGIDSAPQFPPRARVSDAGELATDYRLTPLPRTGTIYTHTTIRIPVPDLASPYSIAVVQLDDSPVRVLLKVTGVPAGDAVIGQHGSVVIRKIADRSGIPDYGYAFWPGRTTQGVQT